MGQFGMQMPGGQLQRGPAINVYTGLLGLAVIGLLAGIAIVAIQSAVIAPGGKAWEVHPYDANKKSYDVKLEEVK